MPEFEKLVSGQMKTMDKLSISNQRSTDANKLKRNCRHLEREARLLGFRQKLR